jgi:4-aminobutyrate aminotransferase-like enzyme
MENSKQLGKVFHEKLEIIKEKFPDHLAYVQGKGLLAALILNDSEGKPLSQLCDRIAELCLQRGLLVVHTGRESIKLAPPLMIDEKALLEGIDVLNSAVEDAIKET